MYTLKAYNKIRRATVIISFSVVESLQCYLIVSHLP